MKRWNFLGLIILVILSPLSSAHHATATNFTQEIVRISGTVEQVRFMNPHSSILVKTQNESNQTVYWLIESDAKSTYMRKGVDLNSIQVGSQIEVSGRKGLRAFTLYLREVVFADGSRFTSDGNE